jgi:hypothetical protein
MSEYEPPLYSPPLVMPRMLPMLLRRHILYRDVSQLVTSSCIVEYIRGTDAEYRGVCSCTQQPKMQCRSWFTAWTILSYRVISCRLFFP